MCGDTDEPLDHSLKIISNAVGQRHTIKISEESGLEILPKELQCKYSESDVSSGMDELRHVL